MRKKNNIGSGTATPPEAFPETLQDALYSDDYVMHEMELQAIQRVIITAKRWKVNMEVIRNNFAEAGGKVKEENGGMLFELAGESIFVSDKDHKVHFVKGSKTRMLLKAVIRAELCRYQPDIAIEKLESAKREINNIHLVRGHKKVADLAAAVGATLDEIARGKLVWNEEEDV